MQHSISLLCRYCTRTSILVREIPAQRGDIDECCNSLIYWILRRCPLKSLLERCWRHPFESHLFNITVFYQYELMHPLKILSTPLSGAPQKCFQSGPVLANAGLGYIRRAKAFVALFLSCMNGWCFGSICLSTYFRFFIQFP